MKTCLSFLLTLQILIIGCNGSSNIKPEFYGFNVDSLIFEQINQSDTFQTKVFCRNYSNKEIKILQIEPGCGCTKTYLMDSIIKVNDSIPIFVTYIPYESNDSGSILKYITVRTNSNPAFLNLVIKGMVNK